ncbi:MAG: hypothetical protein KGJ86_03700 [Chloroflexota bacterium]|nr:hypothetical protein [Chloroflexota bacterium]
MLIQFVLHALGMGVVVFLAAAAAPAVRGALLSRLRFAGGSLSGPAGVLVLLVGDHIVHCWLAFGNLSV